MMNQGFDQSNGNYVNTQGGPVENFASSQLRNNPAMSMAPPQIPQAHLRNSIPYTPLYNSSYMMNSGMNMMPYASYPPYGQQPDDWRNMLMDSGVSQHFQNIENVVRVFGSISTMMNSTLHAIQSSFYSILAVGDQLKQMKTHFGQIYATLSIIRLIKWAVRKVLIFFRIKNPSQMSSVWKEAITEPGPGNSSYPVYAYLFIIYAGPYILMKLYKSIMNSQQDAWDVENSPANSATVVYNYEATKSDELSVTCNQVLKVAPKSLQHDQNWCLVSDGNDRGLVPVNYIHIDSQTGNSPGLPYQY